MPTFTINPRKHKLRQIDPDIWPHEGPDRLKQVLARVHKGLKRHSPRYGWTKDIRKELIAIERIIARKALPEHRTERGYNGD